MSTSSTNDNIVVSEIHWNHSELKKIEKSAQEGLFAMGFDIAAQARRFAPVVTSALRNSIRVETDGSDTVYVKAGGIVATGTQNGKVISRYVDYASQRERGPNRNPATEHYMQHAQEAIMTGDYMKKYFGAKQ